MKKSDIAMIVLIASLSVMVGFFIASNVPFLKLSENGESVDTIERMTSEVTKPDTKVFNSTAINPTVETVIGQ